MSHSARADRVWRLMAAVVFDNRDVWRRDVVEVSGLPFSRIRVLRRLAKRSMTAKQIAEAATMDAPAANSDGRAPYRPTSRPDNGENTNAPMAIGR